MIHLGADNRSKLLMRESVVRFSWSSRYEAEIKVSRQVAGASITRLYILTYLPEFVSYSIKDSVAHDFDVALGVGVALARINRIHCGYF